MSFLLPQGVLGERGVAPLVRVFLRFVVCIGGSTRGESAGYSIGVAVWRDRAPSGGRVLWGWESHLLIVSRPLSIGRNAAAKSSGGGGLAALAFSECSHSAAGFIRLCTPLGWWPKRVLRGRVEGPGRVLRARIEAPRLGGADAAGKGVKCSPFALG